MNTEKDTFVSGEATKVTIKCNKIGTENLHFYSWFYPIRSKKKIFVLNTRSE